MSTWTQKGAGIFQTIEYISTLHYYVFAPHTKQAAYETVVGGCQGVAMCLARCSKWLFPLESLRNITCFCVCIFPKGRVVKFSREK